MKKLLHSRDDASQGAALGIVLGFVMLASAVSLAYFSTIANAVNTTQGIAGGNTSIDVHQSKGSIDKTERPMAAREVSAPCVFIVSATVVNAGNFYMVGDILDPASGNLCNPADNYGFRLQVVSVDSAGRVISVTLIPGIGYSAPPSNPIRFGGSATGIGFTANCTFN